MSPAGGQVAAGFAAAARATRGIPVIGGTLAGALVHGGLRRVVRSGLVLGAVHEDRVMFGVDEDPVLADGDRLLSLEPDRS